MANIWYVYTLYIPFIKEKKTCNELTLTKYRSIYLKHINFCSLYCAVYWLIRLILAFHIYITEMEFAPTKRVWQCINRLAMHAANIDRLGAVLFVFQVIFLFQWICLWCFFFFLSFFSIRSFGTSSEIKQEFNEQTKRITKKFLAL